MVIRGHEPVEVAEAVIFALILVVSIWFAQVTGNVLSTPVAMPGDDVEQASPL